MFCLKYSEYLVHGLRVIIKILFYRKRLCFVSFLAWSFLAQLTENISANTKCHWDIIVLLFFLWLPETNQSWDSLWIREICRVLCIDMKNAHLSPHTHLCWYLDKCPLKQFLYWLISLEYFGITRYPVQMCLSCPWRQPCVCVCRRVYVNPHAKQKIQFTFVLLRFRFLSCKMEQE